MKSAVSLHLRLTGLLVLLVAVLLSIAFIYAEFRSQYIARQDVDGRLRIGVTFILGPSVTLAQRPGTGLSGVDAAGAENNIPAITPVAELRGIDGRLVYRSMGFPQDMPRTDEGFSDQRSAGEDWRVLTVQNTDRSLTGRVAIRDAETRRLAGMVRSNILVPTVAALVLLAIAVLAAIWLGLRPLRDIEREIGRLDVTRPRPLEIDPASMPRELSRLTITLNGLLDRLKQLLRHQQTFVSAAGHELRTPLSGCAAQLDVAQRSKDPAQRLHALTKLDQGLRRMTELVEQLLVIARSERSTLDVASREFDLADLVRELIADLGPSRHRVNVEIRPGQTRVSGRPELIGSLVTNLIDNALRVSPADEKVMVRVLRHRDHMRMDVCDRGPGLTEDQKSRIFESFYSGADGSGPGTGLGLAIVKAVALAHHGDVVAVDRDSGGLCMQVTLPVTGAPGIISRTPQDRGGRVQPQAEDH